MTKDLEETLLELGPGYREVVDRLMGAYRPIGDANGFRVHGDANGFRVHGDANGFRVHRSGRIFRWTAGYLVAASLLVFIGLGVIFRTDGPLAPRRAVSDAQLVYTVAYAADEASLQAIVASQRSDGSWSNDFITRQNAAALRGADGAAALVAYKRALRYLRSRGLEPLSDGELRARANRAARARLT